MMLSLIHRDRSDLKRIDIGAVREVRRNGDMVVLRPADPVTVTRAPQDKVRVTGTADIMVAVENDGKVTGCRLFRWRALLIHRCTRDFAEGAKNAIRGGIRAAKLQPLPAAGDPFLVKIADGAPNVRGPARIAKADIWLTARAAYVVRRSRPAPIDGSLQSLARFVLLA